MLLDQPAHRENRGVLESLVRLVPRVTKGPLESRGPRGQQVLRVRPDRRVPQVRRARRETKAVRESLDPLVRRVHRESRDRPVSPAPPDRRARRGIKDLRELQEQLDLKVLQASRVRLVLKASRGLQASLVPRVFKEKLDRPALRGSKVRPESLALRVPRAHRVRLGQMESPEPQVRRASRGLLA